MGERKAISLVSIMKNGRMPDSELMEVLGLRSANSAAYYRKDLEEQGIIKRYTASVNWKKLHYPTEFIILIEGENMEKNFNIEKEIIASLEDYMEEKGDILILPSGNGRVVISNTITCFGERPMTIVMGHATSEHDALIYFRYYIAEKFVDAKTTFLLVKGKGIEDFFIQGDYIDFMKGSFAEDKAIELPGEFKKHFPSLSAVKTKAKTKK